MLGAFRSTLATCGGLLWKTPWKLSKPRKYRLRKRLQAVDNVVATLVESGVEMKALDSALKKPLEHELPPPQKYFIFSKRSPYNTKGVHKMPHWVKVEHPRSWPVGYKPKISKT